MIARRSCIHGRFLSAGTAGFYLGKRRRPTGRSAILTCRPTFASPMRQIQSRGARGADVSMEMAAQTDVPIAAS